MSVLQGEIDFQRNFMTREEACSILNIKQDTLRKYINLGYIRKHDTTESGKQYVVRKEDVHRMINANMNSNEMKVIYARVNNENNPTPKLNAQIDLITQFMLKNGITVDKVYSDMCKSSEFNKSIRKGIHDLMNDVLLGKIDVIYMLSEDRVSLFGTEMFETLCKLHGAKIVYLTKGSISKEHSSDIRNEMLYTISCVKTKFNL